MQQQLLSEIELLNIERLYKINRNMNKYSYNYMMAQKQESPWQAFLAVLAAFILTILIIWIAYLI